MKALLIGLLTLNIFAVQPSSGFCLAKYTTKKYIQNDFTAPYPKEVIFSCQYECRDMEGQSTEKISGISKIVVTSLTDDALKVVCQGVVVKKSKWGYDYDRTEEFYAHQTNIKEIKEWAKQSIPLENEYTLKLLTEFKDHLKKVYPSYKIAGQSNSSVAKEFAQAAHILEEMSQQLPEGRNLFDEYRLMLQERNGNTGSELTAQKLIMDQILFGASWSMNI
ncbi:hypothetical protein M902_2422 [Bacteriovorax sp. BAL6_X]|uniref:hypothetical protein n=1 Tax=Bacteriovorax sp. BAL6_X TaxID=1201290 RepID=UPI0003867226|nr:hypothetical protein [Bacteriovorax sp. BAL6_X]EPZ52484.1 hypothetical protein M902_2422 [Bacteriovorax sp. BAL6_X]